MHETIDGEVIVINLTSGTYYSLRGSGADIWSLIQDTATQAEVVEALSSRYDTARPELEGAVSGLVIELRAEGLVADIAGDAPTPVERPSLSEGAKLPFDVPRLEKYTDLQDLVLLDPVHQVTDTGWPAPRPVG